MIQTRWSKKLAYAVGLLATDGHLSKDGRHINLTSKDIEQLENFMEAVGVDYKIAKKVGGYTKGICSYIQFSDVNFYKWLLSIGFKQQKTEAIGKLNIPERYFFDFLRGHFDGDGSIYSYFDPRWKSSFMFYITFIAKNKQHVLWLQKKMKKYIKVSGKIGVGSGVHRVRYAKSESKILIKKMYRGKKSLYLSRKYDKILKILQTDAGVRKLVYRHA